MKTGELAKAANCNIETVRYYEKSGLLPVPERASNGYRRYSDAHLKRLSFIRRCRELGFAIDEVKVLLSLIDGGEYSCSDVKTMADQHMAKIRQKIIDLNELLSSLSGLSSQCHDDAPECAMIDALFQDVTEPELCP